jgi:hypothetical protein
MLAIMVPKGIGTKDTVLSAADPYTLKNSPHWINAQKRLADPFSRNTMTESAEHSIEHAKTCTTIMGAQAEQQHVELVI